MTTGAAATSRCVRKYTAAATQNSIMQTKNTRRPSRRPSRRAPIGRRARPEEIRDELALVLDEDAQTMVVKLWRVLLFHAAKAAQRPSA